MISLQGRKEYSAGHASLLGASRYGVYCSETSSLTFGLSGFECPQMLRFCSFARTDVLGTWSHASERSARVAEAETAVKAWLGHD